MALWSGGGGGIGRGKRRRRKEGKLISLMPRDQLNPRAHIDRIESQASFRITAKHGDESLVAKGGQVQKSPNAVRHVSFWSPFK